MIGTQQQPILRIAGRIILLDPDRHVLLLEHRIDRAAAETVWATPGGGLEGSETPAQAARRELSEECGIVVGLADDEVADHTERRVMSFDRVAYDQTDYFYIVRVAQRPQIAVGHRTELEELTVLGHRWFSAEDLRASTTRYEPTQLIELISGTQR
ncbi:MAG TPA: NUDIX domain-containing protein [Jatrophihabitans sp.]